MKEALHLPPVWCSQICRNAMNEICVEHCAIKRDCSGFEEKPNLKLADLPRFPKTNGMSREEKFTSVTIYLAKVVDHLTGVEDEKRTLVIHPPVKPEITVKPKAIAEVTEAVKQTLDETRTEEK